MEILQKTHGLCDISARFHLPSSRVNHFRRILGFMVFSFVFAGLIQLISDERIGCLTFVGANEGITRAILSQIRVIVRSIWSTPPMHGARIVATVLSDPNLRKDWFADSVSSLRLMEE